MGTDLVNMGTVLAFTTSSFIRTQVTYVYRIEVYVDARVSIVQDISIVLAIRDSSVIWICESLEKIAKVSKLMS
ncbi:hypothetical protein [Aquibacillus koreensis]|uniref:hypothetical protein n=1 Tax=Aquibacillus koreensis TaxID=279446 RepID=UPI002340939F|nr:hypothetical protein [Aquibacillus koreensis]